MHEISQIHRKCLVRIHQNTNYPKYKGSPLHPVRAYFGQFTSKKNNKGLAFCVNIKISFNKENNYNYEMT